MLTKQDLKDIGSLLKPLEERMNKMGKRVEKGFKESREDHNIMIDHFDKAFFGLRERVEKLESTRVVTHQIKKK